MRALEYWKAVTADKSAFLDRFLTVLARSGARYCVIGGQGVNAFAEPVVSLDLDLVVATEDMGPLEGVLSSEFRVERFPHSLKVLSRLI